ncbi:hypothetical protein COTS27_01581 [Spirochaetota bacterium]|nr:hypothetical protein COTS27_01581 [Spirochaetota bacterium]
MSTTTASKATMPCLNRADSFSQRVKSFQNRPFIQFSSKEEQLQKQPKPNLKSIMSDAKLIEKVAQGDNHTCKIIIESHITRVYRTAYRVLHNKSEAEDVAQEAFIKLWQKAPQWQAKSQIITWLYRVTLNAAIDKKRKRPPGKEVNIDDHDYQLPARTSAEETITDLEKRQSLLSLNKAIEALPERQQTVIQLSYFENLKVKDIAAVMKISIRAAESLLKRSRTHLKLSLLSQKRPFF